MTRPYTIRARCGVLVGGKSCRNPVSVGAVHCMRHRQFPEDAVNHPAHYGGEDNPYETIKVIEAWDLNFNLGNALKYISRAGKKDAAKAVEDLRKAKQYLDFEISRRSRG